LRLQFGTSSPSVHGVRRYLPYAFTEPGVAMLSSVLHSDRAIQVNIAIMRAVVQLRCRLATHEDLGHKIDEMEKRYDSKFQAVFPRSGKCWKPRFRPSDRSGSIPGLGS
jgi:hypothetical protein